MSASRLGCRVRGVSPRDPGESTACPGRVEYHLGHRLGHVAQEAPGRESVERVRYKILGGLRIGMGFLGSLGGLGVGQRN